jgi:hypothetical protein
MPDLQENGGRDPDERRRRRRVLVWALPLITGMVAFGLIASLTSSPVNEDTSSSDASAAPVRLTSIDGQAVALPTGRPGMIMLSTSGCVSCFVSAKSMANYMAEAPQRVDAAFISVDAGDSPEALAARRQTMGGAPYPFAIDTTGQLLLDYGVTALGTVVIYDATGTIVAKTIEPSLPELRAGFARAGVQ